MPATLDQPKRTPRARTKRVVSSGVSPLAILLP
jgi:hypothetical protein